MADLKTNLIEKEKDPTELIPAMTKLFHLMSWPTLAAMLHPVYMVVNSVFIG